MPVFPKYCYLDVINFKEAGVQSSLESWDYVQRLFSYCDDLVCVTVLQALSLGLSSTHSITPVTLTVNS